MKNIVRLIALAFVCFATNSFAMESDENMKEVSLASVAAGLKTAAHEPVEMLCEGFPSGTLVQTVGGDVPIEQLRDGDQVYAYDFNGNFGSEVVFQAVKRHTNVLIQITIDGETVLAAPGQRFFLVDNAWIEAADLRVGDFLQRTGDSLPIDAIEAISVQTEVYSLTVTNYENFCITSHGLIVHNVVPLFVYLGNIAVYAGTNVFIRAAPVILEKVCEVAAQVAVTAGAAYLAKKLNNHEKKSRKSHKNSNQPYYQKDPDNQSCDLTLIQAEDKPSCGDSNDCEDLHDPTKYTRQSDGTYISVSDATWWGKIFGSGQSFVDNSQPPKNSGGAKNNTHASRKSKIIKLLNCGGCGGKPPNDPKDPRKNGIYKDAPYHLKDDRPGKSRRPTNGQHALDNSFEIPKKLTSTSTRRLAISGDEFVVLNQTREGEFHGHVREWKDLTKPMRRELLRRKLVSNSGKIKK